MQPICLLQELQTRHCFSILVTDSSAQNFLPISNKLYGASSNIAIADSKCQCLLRNRSTATSNCYGTITATTVNQPIYNVQGKGVLIGLTMMVTEILPAQQTVVISDTTAPVANITNLPTVTGHVL
jgi:hypothetical protein